MSDQPPLVSIVTATLNSAAFIREHLASVDAQTYPNIEHVFVDGVSTDGTVEIIKEYAANHKVTWVSESDSNCIEATSKGLAMCTGDIVAVVPSDDLLFPWSVETVVAFFREHPEIDAVVGDSLRRSPAGEYTVHLEPPYSWDRLARGREGPVPPATYFRRPILAGARNLDTTLLHAADLEWYLRLFRKRRVANLREILGIFVKRPGAVNMTGTAAEWEREYVELASRHVSAHGSHLRALRAWDYLVKLVARRLLWLRMSVASRFWRGDGHRSPWKAFLGTHQAQFSSLEAALKALLPRRRTSGLRIRKRPVRR